MWEKFCINLEYAIFLAEKNPCGISLLMYDFLPQKNTHTAQECHTPGSERRWVSSGQSDCLQKRHSMRQLGIIDDLLSAPTVRVPLTLGHTGPAIKSCTSCGTPSKTHACVSSG